MDITEHVKMIDSSGNHTLVKISYFINGKLKKFDMFRDNL